MMELSEAKSRQLVVDRVLNAHRVNTRHLVVHTMNLARFAKLANTAERARQLAQLVPKVPIVLLGKVAALHALRARFPIPTVQRAAFFVHLVATKKWKGRPAARVVHSVNIQRHVQISPLRLHVLRAPTGSLLKLSGRLCVSLVQQEGGQMAKKDSKPA
jgi:hypothetical protein